MMEIFVEIVNKFLYPITNLRILKVFYASVKSFLRKGPKNARRLQLKRIEKFRISEKSVAGIFKKLKSKSAPPSVPEPSRTLVVRAVRE